MKKSLNLVLSLILVFLVCGGGLFANAASVETAGSGGTSETAKSGGTAETEGLAGMWKMVEITGEDPASREDVKSMEKLGMIIYLHLKEDGTAELSAYGETLTGTWTQESIVLEGTAVSFTMEGDELLLDNKAGSIMVLERTTEAKIDEILGNIPGVLDENVKYSTEKEKILDVDEAGLTITGYKADKSGFAISVLSENKTDKKITISADKAYANKCAFNVIWAVSLEGKESKESVMKFSPEDLDRAGISSIDEVILLLSVMDNEKSEFLQKRIPATVYPTGKKAEDIKIADRTPVEDELVVIDDENAVFVIEGIDPEDIMGYGVKCYCENKTDHTMTFILGEDEINDKDVTSIFAEELLPGTRKYSEMYYLRTSLEKAEIEIEEIKKITGIIRVYTKEDDMLKKVEEKEFTYEP